MATEVRRCISPVRELPIRTYGPICSVDGAAFSTVAPEPVDAQDGRVVGKDVARAVEDEISQCANRLARMQPPRVTDCLGEVEASRVALEHAVGQQDQPVAGLQ